MESDSLNVMSDKPVCCSLVRCPLVSDLGNATCNQPGITLFQIVLGCRGAWWNARFPGEASRYHSVRSSYCHQLKCAAEISVYGILTVYLPSDCSSLDGLWFAWSKQSAESRCAAPAISGNVSITEFDFEFQNACSLDFHKKHCRIGTPSSHR